MTVTNLKAVKATIWIMVNGQKYTSTENMGGVADELMELVEEKGEDVLKYVELVNVLNVVHNLERFGMQRDAATISIGDLDIGDATYTYKINSGEYYEREFDSEEELADFFKDKVESGQMDIDEVKSTEILVEMYQNATFEDADSEPGTIFFEEDMLENAADRFTYKCMGATFYHEDDAQDEFTALDQQISGLKDDVEHMKGNVEEQVKFELDRLASSGVLLPKVTRAMEDMTFEELADELAKLNQTAQTIKKLMVEKSRDDL